MRTEAVACSYYSSCDLCRDTAARIGVSQSMVYGYLCRSAMNAVQKYAERIARDDYAVTAPGAREAGR